MDTVVMTRHAQTSATRFMLWIDGVGAWLLCTDDSVSIGGPSLKTAAADICLMSSLSRRHATITRDDETWFINPHAVTRVNDRPLENPALLRHGDRIELGGSVELSFALPSALSASASLDFVSGHRPSQSVDGVVLMQENCLLGPGRENHIRCPHWPETVILFKRDGAICCRSRTEIFVDGNHVQDSETLSPGAVVTGDELSFRFEPV